MDAATSSEASRVSAATRSTVRSQDLGSASSSPSCPVSCSASVTTVAAMKMRLAVSATRRRGRAATITKNDVAIKRCRHGDFSGRICLGRHR